MGQLNKFQRVGGVGSAGGREAEEEEMVQGH